MVLVKVCKSNGFWGRRPVIEESPCDTIPYHTNTNTNQTNTKYTNTITNYTNRNTNHRNTKYTRQAACNRGVPLWSGRPQAGVCNRDTLTSRSRFVQSIARYHTNTNTNTKSYKYKVYKYKYKSYKYKYNDTLTSQSRFFQSTAPAKILMLMYTTVIVTLLLEIQNVWGCVQ